MDDFIDRSPWPGPAFEMDYLTDEDGIMYPDTQNYQEVFMWRPHYKQALQPGDMVCEDGHPLGVCVSVTYNLINPDSANVVYQSNENY